MLELNKVMLIGNLTRDPELSYLASGTALAKMGLAVNRSWKDKNGQWQRDTMFVDIDAWGNQAEFCSKYLKKGRRVFVEGQLRQNTWEGNDGTKRSKISVNADRVQFADSAPRSGEDAGTGDGEPSGEQYHAPQQQRSAAPAQPAARQPFPEPASGSGFGAGQSSEESTADDLPF
jgi:single-strand DNA-binding protein